MVFDALSQRQARWDSYFFCRNRLARSKWQLILMINDFICLSLPICWHRFAALPSVPVAFLWSFVDMCRGVEILSSLNFLSCSWSRRPFDTLQPLDCKQGPFQCSSWHLCHFLMTLQFRRSPHAVSIKTLSGVSTSKKAGIVLQRKCMLS